MSKVDIHANEFGTGPGLEVALRWVEGGRLLLDARLDGLVFESYTPRDLDTALAAAACLIRGSQPPRGLFLCRDTPSR